MKEEERVKNIKRFVPNEIVPSTNNTYTIENRNDVVRFDIGQWIN